MTQAHSNAGQSGTETADSIPYTWVLTSSAFREMILTIAEGNYRYITVDLETSGTDPWREYEPDGWPTSVTMAAITIDVAGDLVTWVVPLAHPESPFNGYRVAGMLAEIAKAILRGARPLVNQNLRFDLAWLWRFTEIDLVDLFAWDTMVAAHLIDENQSTKLKDLVPRLFGIPSWADVDLNNGAHRVELFALGHYAARDTYWTSRLFLFQQEILGTDIEDAYDIREEAITHEERADGRLAMHFHAIQIPMEKALHLNERTGVALDETLTHEALAEREQIEAATFDEIKATDPYHFEQWEADGMVVKMGATSKFFKSLTARAVEAGRLRVTAYTGTGQPQWNKVVLVGLARDGYELAQMLLDWRAATKQSEYLRSWLDHLTPEGRVHPRYKSTSTVTGRTSSSEPNIQQVTKIIKPSWRASRGCVFAEVDYSQIELRVAAFVAQCKPMIDAYLRGDDLHSLMAAMVMDVGIDEVTGEMRQRGKAGNFGFLFGMSATGFVEYAANQYDVSFTLDEAEEFRNAFFTMWEGLSDWHARFEMEATRYGYVASPLGRIRHIPDAVIGDDWEVGRALRQAINSPIQSMASDMLQISNAMVSGKVAGVRGVEGVTVLGSVHDSLLMDVREDGWEQRLDRVLDLMVTEVPLYLHRMLGVSLNVPLSAEAEVGPAWGIADSVIEKEGALVAN